MITRLKLFSVLIALFVLIPNYAFAYGLCADRREAQVVEFTVTVGGVDYVCDFNCRSSAVLGGVCTSLTGDVQEIRTGRLAVRNVGLGEYPSGYSGSFTSSFGHVVLNYIAAANNQEWGSGIMQITFPGELPQSSALRYRSQ